MTAVVFSILQVAYAVSAGNSATGQRIGSRENAVRSRQACVFVKEGLSNAHYVVENVAVEESQMRPVLSKTMDIMEVVCDDQAVLANRVAFVLFVGLIRARTEILVRKITIGREAQDSTRPLAGAAKSVHKSLSAHAVKLFSRTAGQV